MKFTIFPHNHGPNTIVGSHTRDHFYHHRSLYVGSYQFICVKSKTVIILAAYDTATSAESHCQQTIVNCVKTLEKFNI
jgi:hypothetical protein